MKYKIVVDENLEKFLQRIRKKNLEKIQEKIIALSDDPRPRGCIKLKGSPKHLKYRIRCGNYRIIYQVKDVILTILIVDMDDRKDVYN